MKSLLFDTDPETDTEYETSSLKSKISRLNESKSESTNSNTHGSKSSDSKIESSDYLPDCNDPKTGIIDYELELKDYIANKNDSTPKNTFESWKNHQKDLQDSFPRTSSTYPWVFRAFLASNLTQYLLIFLAVPFSDVENRPPVFVLSCLLGSLSFVLSALMLPAGLVNVPTSLSHTCSGATLALKTADVVANVLSVVVCLNAEIPMVEYHIDRKTHLFVPLDITKYIQIMSILLLAAAAVSMLLALLIYLFNCFYIRAGRADREGHEDQDQDQDQVQV